MESTLYEMHRKSGKTFREVLEFVAAADPEGAPKSPESIAMLVRRGTDRNTYIRALAAAWGRPEKEVEAAAKRSQREYREKRLNARTAKQFVINPLQSV